MGVPAFFKWLSVRYPKCVINAFSKEDLEIAYEEYKTIHGLDSSAAGGTGDPNEINLGLDGEEPSIGASTAIGPSRDRADEEFRKDQRIKDNNP